MDQPSLKSDKFHIYRFSVFFFLFALMRQAFLRLSATKAAAEYKDSERHLANMTSEILTHCNEIMI